MAMEGILSHFPRERAVVLVHHIDRPEPCALMTDLGMNAFALYGLEGPVTTVIDGVDFGPGAQRWRRAEEVYEQNRSLVTDHLAEGTDVTITLDATLAADGTVSGTVGVTAPDARLLRVQVVYSPNVACSTPAVDRRRQSHGRPRSMLDSVDGVRLEKGEGEQTMTFSRTLEEIARRTSRTSKSTSKRVAARPHASRRRSILAR